MEFCDFDVITALTATEAEVRLVEICRTRQFWSGNMSQGVLIEVVQHPLNKRPGEENDDEGESNKRDAIVFLDPPHLERYFFYII